MGLLVRGEALARQVHQVHRQTVGLLAQVVHPLAREQAGCLQLILQVAQMVLQALLPLLAHQVHQVPPHLQVQTEL
jgi:hypothetical protein